MDFADPEEEDRSKHKQNLFGKLRKNSNADVVHSMPTNTRSSELSNLADISQDDMVNMTVDRKAKIDGGEIWAPKPVRFLASILTLFHFFEKSAKMVQLRCTFFTLFSKCLRPHTVRGKIAIFAIFSHFL